VDYFFICFAAALVLTANIACSNITPVFPKGYFNQITNACLVILSIIIAIIYAVVTILKSSKIPSHVNNLNKKIGACITVSTIPFLGLGFIFFSLVISAFSYEQAREFLVASVLITISSFGVTYLVIAYLLESDDKSAVILNK
jgi:hypothetical protein